VNTEENNGQEEKSQIGALLEKKRREKGLSLEEVEQATKIRARYLESLEREDYGVLPDAVYVQGFLKTYANFLGLDGEQLSRELKNRRSPRRERQFGGHEDTKVSDFDRPLIAPGSLDETERWRVSGTTVLMVALAVLILAAVIGGLYLIGARSAGEPGGANEPEVQKETPVQTIPEPSPAVSGSESTSQAPTAETTTDTFRATVRVANSPSGLTIRTDGTVAYDNVAQPGFSQTFEARDTITVEARNAGAVQVEANGQNVGALGSYGQGATRTFTRQSGG
jgi:cytoskeleton protein RodZ